MPVGRVLLNYASRKAWVAYINLSTVVHRQLAEQADEHIAQVRAGLEQAVRRYL